MAKITDLTGQVFGRWTVMEIAPKETAMARWICRCVCGTIKAVYGCHLRSGKSQSCGCFAIEQTKVRETIHGMDGTPEYHAYIACKGRCRNLNNHAYNRYGGRGIEFRFDSFVEFFAELGIRPGSHYSVDRIDNDGHYEAGNVRWATPEEQGRNTSSNHYLTIGGVRKCIAEWGDVSGIDGDCIERRVNLLGWCDECAVTLPPHLRCVHLPSVSYKIPTPKHGETNPASKLTEKDIPRILQMFQDGISMRQIAQAFNVSPYPIRRICKGNGWSHVKLQLEDNN